MKKSKIVIMGIVLVCAVLILLSFVETKEPVKSNPMKQIFYTEEGTPYVVKCATVFDNISVPVNNDGVLLVQANTEAGVFPSQERCLVTISPSQRIIPISCFLGIVDIAGVRAEAGSVYYWCIPGKSVPAAFTIVNFAAMSKMLPLIQREFFTSANSYQYSVKYNQAVFKDSDFIDVSSGMTFIFCSLPATMMTNGASPGGSFFTLATGDYTRGIIFTYFEMIKQ